MYSSPVYFKSLVTVLVLAVVFVLVALPLVLRKVPPNSLYGFRTPATLKNEKIWYEANAHFGRGMIMAGIASVLAILVLYFIVRPAPDLFFMMSLVLLVVPSAIAALLTFIHIRKLRDT